jgi:transcriptional regulator with XRE-family HTH domain
MKNNIIGERIQLRRKELKMTQSQLAELTGYSDKTAISKIENGISDLTQSKIVLFANVLHTSPSYIMGWVEESSPKEERDEIQKQRLLAYYNELTDKQKSTVMELMEVLVSNNEK